MIASFIFAPIVAPVSSQGAATTHAPKSTFRKRAARLTSAIAMIATVTINAPTRSSLWAAVVVLPPVGDLPLLVSLGLGAVWY